MFHDLVIPKYEATHNRKKLFRCQHCIHCIENRSIWEFKWEKWGFLKRLTWRINNIPFILTSWMYRTYYGSFPVFHGREPLQIMAYSLFLFYFRAEIITGQSSNRLWAAIFFCAALWFLLKLIYVCGIKLAIFILKFARNLKRGQNND